MPKFHVRDIQMVCDVQGKGDPIVQIHGSAFGRGNFAALSPHLARAFTVIDPDLRGFGDSDQPEQRYSLELWADDLSALIKALGYERVHIHGTSMGGLVAIPFAAKYPEQVGGLVLSATLAKYDKANRMVKDVWKAVVEKYGKGEVFEDLLALQLFSRTYIDTDRFPASMDLVRKLLRSQTNPAIFQEITRVTLEADVRHYLPQIQAPTLVIAAEYDLITPLDMGPSGAGGRVIAETILGARLHVFKGSAHMFLIEQPEETSRVMGTFLRTVPLR